MEIDSNRSLPTRKKHRLQKYDYSTCGAYFITFNTAKDIRLSTIIGEIGDNTFNAEVQLNDRGKIVETMIDRINYTYENASITDYIIMPNHVHLIIELYDKNTIGLSGYIGLLKRLCNKEIGCNVWQRSFYDHVITSDEDYYNHCQYINENPRKWVLGKDKYYS